MTWPWISAKKARQEAAHATRAAYDRGWRRGHQAGMEDVAVATDTLAWAWEEGHQEGMEDGALAAVALLRDALGHVVAEVEGKRAEA